MADMLTPDEEEFALERIVRNQLTIKALEEENAQLKLFFKERSDDYPAGSMKRRGKFYIKVTTNSRIDQKLADTHLTMRERNSISKLTVDAAKARAYLSPEKLAQITKVYDNKLEIGIAD